MPYTSAEEAVQHSDYYTKFRELERERIRKQILEKRTDYLTNPKFNTSLTRDSRGFILSFENPDLFGKANEPEYEQVTIDIKEKYFNTRYLEKINTTFEDLVN